MMNRLKKTINIIGNNLINSKILFNNKLDIAFIFYAVNHTQNFADSHA